MKPRKEGNVFTGKGHQPHSADSSRPNHFRFPHFLHPISSATSAQDLRQVANATGNSVHSELRSVEEAPDVSGQRASLNAELHTIWSSNAMARKLLNKWRDRVEELGRAPVGRATLRPQATSANASPSIASSTMLAELAVDITRACALASQHAEAAKKAGETEYSQVNNRTGHGDYGPLSAAALADRRRASRSETGNDDAVTLTLDHQRDLQAALASMLLCHLYGPKMGADGVFYSLLKLVIGSAYCDHPGTLPKDKCSYSFNGEAEGEGEEVGEATHSRDRQKSVHFSEGALLPPSGLVPATATRRSYRELYAELAEKRNKFLRRPERVLERLGATKSKLILRLVFLAWRAGFRLRQRKYHFSGERAEYLFTKKRGSLLALRFGQWRRYVQKHGRHKRVLQYEGSKDKLIQRLARRVEQLEFERMGMANELDSLRHTQRKVKDDLLDIRRLVLGDKDAERFEQLVADREERLAAVPATARPSHHAPAAAVQAKADLPLDSVEPPPSDMARQYLHTFLAQMEREAEEEDVKAPRSAAAQPNATVSADSSSPPPSHIQLLDWVLLRCQTIGSDILFIKDHVLEEERERKAQANKFRLPSDDVPATDVEGQGTSGLMVADEVAATLAKRPRNFVADFADGMRLSFLLISVGYADQLLPAKVSKLNSERRRQVLQQSFNSVMGHSPAFGSADADSSEEGYLHLTGSKLAKVILSLYQRFQGTPIVNLDDRARALFFKVAEDASPNANGSTARHSLAPTTGPLDSASSDSEDSVHSVYERVYTQEELAEKWGGESVGESDKAE